MGKKRPPSGGRLIGAEKLISWQLLPLPHQLLFWRSRLMTMALFHRSQQATVQPSTGSAKHCHHPSGPAWHQSPVQPFRRSPEPAWWCWYQASQLGQESGLRPEPAAVPARALPSCRMQRVRPTLQARREPGSFSCWMSFVNTGNPAAASLVRFVTGSSREGDRSQGSGENYKSGATISPVKTQSLTNSM